MTSFSLVGILEEMPREGGWIMLAAHFEARLFWFLGLAEKKLHQRELGESRADVSLGRGGSGRGRRQCAALMRLVVGERERERRPPRVEPLGRSGEIFPRGMSLGKMEEPGERDAISLTSGLQLGQKQQVAGWEDPASRNPHAGPGFSSPSWEGGSIPIRPR